MTEQLRAALQQKRAEVLLLFPLIRLPDGRLSQCDEAKKSLEYLAICEVALTQVDEWSRPDDNTPLREITATFTLLRETMAKLSAEVQDIRLRQR